MELLTAAQAASYLQIHPETLRRKTRAKKVPAWRIGPFWRYRREVLDEWLAQGCPSQAEQPSLFDHANGTGAK